MKFLKSEFGRYISLSILGMLGSSGTILADTFFVSNRLGSEGLAALNLAISVFGLINGVGMMFGIGGATRYAIFRTQGNQKKADETFTLAFACALTAGILFWLIGQLFSGEIVRLLGAEDSIYPMCRTYLYTVLCFAPCFILNHLFMAFIRNDGSPRLAMCTMMTGSLANIVLDYLFIYPFGMGIFGAALATGLSPVIGLGVSSLHRIYGRNRFHFTRVIPSLREIRATAGIGLSAFFNEFSSSIVLVVFNLLILRAAGTVGVAAYGIVANLALVVLAVFTGISQGIQPLISRAHGRCDRQEIASLTRKSLLLAAGIGTVVFGIAFLGASGLVSWFNPAGDTALQSIAESGLRLYFVGFLFVGCNIVTASRFSATERAGAAFFLSFFRGFVGIIALAAVFSALWGMTGIWLAFPAAELLTLGIGWKLSQGQTESQNRYSGPEHSGMSLTAAPLRKAAD